MRQTVGAETKTKEVAPSAWLLLILGCVCALVIFAGYLSNTHRHAFLRNLQDTTAPLDVIKWVVEHHSNYAGVWCGGKNPPLYRVEKGVSYKILVAVLETCAAHYQVDVSLEPTPTRWPDGIYLQPPPPVQ